MQLVKIKKLDLVANTMAIAEGVKKDHETIIKLVEALLNKSELAVRIAPGAFRILCHDKNMTA